MFLLYEIQERRTYIDIMGAFLWQQNPFQVSKKRKGR